ncbi:MAG: HlyD family type I secretion periplasmic adaptor subunit [Alphaproteobacteria bacterium]|nr:HlyD family type I secretion periplasmic adaptor subunit [Alphaproteobacteria bacterium]
MSEPAPPPRGSEPAPEHLAATHLFIALSLLALAALTTWAWFGRLDVVSVAVGEVTPATQIKAIQHLEGGIVSRILVREGQPVVRDQPLVELESTSSGADVGELTLRIAALDADVARFEAEMTDADSLLLPETLRRAHPELAEQAAAEFSSRREAFRNTQRTQQEAVVQRAQAIKEIDSRIRNNREALKLMQEQIHISEELLKKDLTNRLNHLALLREANTLKGKIDEDASVLARAESALKEGQSQLAGLATARQKEINEHLSKARRDQDEMKERMKKFSDSLRRTVLRSPVDGLVKTVYVTTRGGVVQPGKTVVDIVPAGDRLVVEAKLAVYDVGYVKTGQKAFIRLASQDASRFGDLSGTVVNISPDSIVTDKGAYYKVRIETAGDRFVHKHEEYRLLPGIQVTASIVTGQRSVLEYIFDPLFGRMGLAFRER